VVYGHSAFVNAATGTGGIPLGCYTGTACHIVTTISLGHRTLARTGSESVLPGGTGILFFTLTQQGKKLLRHAHGARLGVKVGVRDVGGTTETANLTLIPFTTSGRGPSRRVSQTAVTQFLGTTDFVFARGAGGILAGCGTASPCPVSATLWVGGTRIATTRPELVGGGELGYVYFSLTRQGRALLAAAPGNQLGAKVKLSCAGFTATARIALVRFS
jgi:hypothetical protein